LAILNRVRAAVKSVDPDQQVVNNVRDLDQWIEREDEYAYGRLSAALLTSISVVALLLAAIGLFSVVSYAVAQRTNELGIRMALGASKVQVLNLVLQGTARYVLAGLACGSLLSVMLRPAVSKWAEGSTYSIAALSSVTLLLILTAALAAVIPARRASSIEPMEALRYD
jgi:ABC-type antimicrobial peptide transport system permease subunit